MIFTQEETKKLLEDFKYGKFHHWIKYEEMRELLEKKESNKNKTLREKWQLLIKENVRPNNYTHFFTLTLRDGRVKNGQYSTTERFGNYYSIVPGIQRYKKAITKFENLLRRAPVTHYALVTEEGGQKGKRDINLHTHGVLRYTGDWDIPHFAFMQPFEEWGTNQGFYRLEVIGDHKGRNHIKHAKSGKRSAQNYLTKYLTKENNMLWHFGLFNKDKEYKLKDYKKIHKGDQINSKIGVNSIRSNMDEVQLEFEGKQFLIDPNKFMKIISNKRK